MPRSNYQPDPRLDLVLERIVDVPQELVLKAWTSPEHLKPWFTPAPWKTVDLRNRSSARRDFPDGDALTGGTGVPQRRLLP